LIWQLWIKRISLKEKNEFPGSWKILKKDDLVLTEAIAELEAKIANRQSELKVLEESLMASRSQILNLEK